MIFVEWHEAISLYTSGCLVYNNIMNFWLAQAVGAVGAILTIISYFVGSKKHFYCFKLCHIYFMHLHFGRWYICRRNKFYNCHGCNCIILYFWNEKSKYSLAISSYILYCLYTCWGLFMKTYFDIVVIITPILYIFGVWLKDVDNVKLALLLPNATLVAYDIVLGAFTNSITDFVETGVASISAILILIKRAKLKKQRQF